MQDENDEKLVGLREMAQILDVHPSFLYGLTRLQAKGENDLPVIRVGKYLKFRPRKTINYFEDKSRPRQPV